jgi:gluconolactonase
VPLLVFDPRFQSVFRVDSAVERLCTGALWSEGPVWLQHSQTLAWSDIPNNRMLAWNAATGLSTHRSPSHFSNGNTLDREGRMVTCEHGRRCVSRTELDGSVSVLVDRYEGRRLNSPNDVVVKSDGTIWFTDPSYGIMSNYEGYQAESELGDHCYVFCFDPATSKLRIVEDSFLKPNGLAFSLDERLLYVTDTSASHDPNGHHHVRVFDVSDDGHLCNGRLFAEVNPGLPDGFRLDTAGRLYVSSEDSIQVFDPDGTLLGKILVPEKISNCVFGGAARNELFITASTSLYRIVLNAQGAPIAGRLDGA